jgi:hypothetical protein
MTSAKTPGILGRAAQCPGKPQLGLRAITRSHVAAGAEITYKTLRKPKGSACVRSPSAAFSLGYVSQKVYCATLVLLEHGALLCHVSSRQYLVIHTQHAVLCGIYFFFADNDLMFQNFSILAELLLLFWNPREITSPIFPCPRFLTPILFL